MREIEAQVTAARAAAVIHETFGHLDAKPGEIHKGYFIFINGQHGDMDVVYSDFPTFGEGPGYFNDRGDFIWELIRDDGPCAAVGIYRFDGEYHQPKRKGSARFVGKTICIQKFGENKPMSTITKEFAQDIIRGHGYGVAPSAVEALARIALTSLEAEPVAWLLSGGGAKNNVSFDSGNAYADPLREVTPLYTASPAPVSVPDVVSWEDVPEEITEDDIALASAWAHGFNQCRSAMIQGAEPVTTANKLPANTPCKEAPEHIWLQTAGVWPENGEFSELTWCSSNQHQDDTLYVRADLVEVFQIPEPVSERYKLRDAVETIRNSGIAIDAEKIFAERDALNAPDCWCRTCRPITLTDMRFVVCPECGNKRCPHANDHRNACTGSNEPGQEGSAYPAAPQQEE